MDNIEIYKDKINLALKRFLDKKSIEDGKYSKEIKELIENVIEYNMRGGKRIRPVTIIFAFKCFKGIDDEKIIDAAISLELMQAFLLIQDDIMDKSDLRRGGETIHKTYEKKYGKDFGVSMGILAGDLCASYTYESIIQSGFGDKEKVKALEYISWIINREIYGQTLDVIPGFSDLTEENIWKIYELKTGSYTMQGPIYLACVLADASTDMIEKLQEFAYNLGIAFQLQDDLNGVFGKIEEIGKPTDSDIKEGKKTLLIVKALELSSSAEKQFLLNNYGKSEISIDDIKKIKEIIEKCGALQYCENKLNEMIVNAKKSIADIDLRIEGKEYLLEMADYIKSLYK